MEYFVFFIFALVASCLIYAFIPQRRQAIPSPPSFMNIPLEGDVASFFSQLTDKGFTRMMADECFGYWDNNFVIIEPRYTTKIGVIGFKVKLSLGTKTKDIQQSMFRHWTNFLKGKYHPSLITTEQNDEICVTRIIQFHTDSNPTSPRHCKTLLILYTHGKDVVAEVYNATKLYDVLPNYSRFDDMFK